MKPILTIAALVLAAGTAQAQQEPFGQNIGAWRFSQAPHQTRVICRAFAGSENIVGRTGDGEMYVSVPANGIPRGPYRESTLIAGGATEPVDAVSDGQRFVLPVDKDQIGRIVRAGGYQWRAMVDGRIRSGTVMFDRDVGAAVSRLQECSRANGGR
jgi:hypothetical protein